MDDQYCLDALSLIWNVTDNDTCPRTAASFSLDLYPAQSELAQPLDFREILLLKKELQTHNNNIVCYHWLIKEVTE